MYKSQLLQIKKTPVRNFPKPAFYKMGPVIRDYLISPDLTTKFIMAIWYTHKRLSPRVFREYCSVYV